MARPVKKGFEYFPCDVNLPNDIKVRKLIKRNGGGAVWVYICTLTLIYKNGYYVDFDSDTPFVLSELTGFNESYINEVIDSCMSLELFSRNMYDDYGVLTSNGIQRRYLAICQTAKRKLILDKYSLILENKELILSDVSSEEIRVSSEEIPVNSEETDICSEITSINSKFSTQRKEKKSKVKKSKVNGGMQNKGLISLAPPPAFDFNRVIRDYNNAVAGYGTQVQRLTEKRKQMLLKCFAEMGNDYSVLEAVFLKIKQSKYLRGDNPRNWSVSFDWLFGVQDAWVKVYEGNFDDGADVEKIQSVQVAWGKNDKT